jgi:hypothetical protein
METTTKVQVLETWDDLIAFVLMAILTNKTDAVEVAHARIQCENMERTEIRAAQYKGPEKGEKFFMPLGDADRVRLQNLLLLAKNPSNSFVTVSRQGVKLIWSISRAND